jgi:HK97 gp10 family phage protein
MASVYKQNGITIDVTEIEKLLAKFGDITPNLMRKSLRRGFAAIGKEVKATQKASLKKYQYKVKRNYFSGSKLIRKGTVLKSALEKSITIKMNVDMKFGKAYMFCGPKRNAPGDPSKYAHFIEFGVKPHKIKVSEGRNAGRIFNHPGYKAQPFIAPSYEAIRLRAQRMMLDAMEQAIKESLK